MLASLLALGAGSARAQLTITWGGGNGSWNNSLNWVLLSLPGLLDTAQVTSGNPTIDSSTSVANLALSGGNVGGAASLTLTGASSVWSGGSLNASGLSSLTISSGGTLAITGSVTHSFDQRTITDNGTINWQGGTLDTGHGGSITVATGGSLNDTSSGAIQATLGGQVNTMIINGTYNKNSGSSTLSVPVVNFGTINLNAGTLTFAAGDSNQTGSTFNVASGATLAVTGGNFSFVPGGNLIDAGGNYTVSGGTLNFGSKSFSIGNVTVSGGTLNLNSGTLSAASLTLSSGTLSGNGNYTVGSLAMSGGQNFGQGTLTLTGSGTWSGGSMATAGLGNFVVQNGGTLTLSSAFHDSSGRSITNDGTVNWQGGAIIVGSSSGLTNAADGVFNDSASTSFTNAGDLATAPFTNSGTYNKTAGSSTFLQPFNNTGTLNLNAGTLAINDGGSNASGATVNVASGATLRIGGGTFTLASGGDVTDSGGSYSVSGGTLALTSGTLSAGSLSVSSGSVSPASGSTVGPTSLALSGGSLAGAGNYTTGTFAETGGSFNGTGTLTLTGSGSAWSGGDMNGAGSLVIQSGATLAASTTTHDFNFRTITNNGTFNWSGGTLRTGGGGGFTNATGAVFNDTVTNDAIQYAFGGAVGSFANAGTYNKNASGTTSISLPLTNTGTVNVNSGTFSIGNGGSDSAGAKVNVASGTTLNFSSGAFTFASAADLVDSGGSYTVSGGTLAFTSGSLSVGSFAVTSGSVSFNGGALTSTTLSLSGGALAGPGNYNAGTYTQSGGSFSGTGALSLTGLSSVWSGGDMNGAGSLTIQSGAVLAITSNTHDFNQRAVFNDGTINWSGGTLRTGGGGSFSNGSGGVFNDTVTNDAIQYAFGGAVGSFKNAGTYNKNAAGTTSVSLPFVNTGTVNVNSGTLAFGNGGSDASGSKIDVAAGSALNFTGGTFTFASTLDLVGSSASYFVSGGTLAFTSAPTTPSLSIANLSISGGSLNLPSTNGVPSVFANTLTLSGGSLTGGGSYSVCTFTQTGGSVASTGVLVLTGSGSVWSGGDMNGFGGSLAVSSGATLAIKTNTHDFNGDSLENFGTINWSGGTLRTGSGGNLLNSSGAVFNDTVSNDAIQYALGGAVGTFNNAGTYNKNAAGTTTITLPFGNTGTVNVNAGTLALGNGGTNSAGAPINVAAGAALNFTGGTFTVASAPDIMDSGGSYFVSGGNLSFTAGSLSVGAFTVSSGSSSFSSGNGLTAGALTLSGGSLSGPGNYTAGTYTQTGGEFLGTGTLTLTGRSSTWSGGDMNGAGSLVIQSGASLSATTTTHDFNSRTITNNGTFNWSAGTLRTGNGGGIVNATGGIFNDTISNDDIQYAFGGTQGSFANAGTYNKNATGTTRITLPVANTGTINVNAGTLNFGNGGTNASGSKVNVASGAGLNFSSGTFTFASAPDLVDAGGSYSVTGGNLVFSAGSLALPMLSVSNGSIGFTTGSLTLQSLALSGGTFGGAGDTTIVTFTETGGELTNTGTTTLTGAGSTWTGGDMNGAGTLSIQSGAALAISGTTHDFNSRTIVNNGTINWSGGTLRTGNGGGITNSAGAVFNDTIANDAIQYAFGGPVGSFTNAGTYNKNSGTTSISLPLVNSGTVNVNAGTFSVNGGGSGSGTFATASGATTFFNSDYTLGSGASLTGSGQYALTNGNLTVAGTLAVTNLSETGGTLSPNGALTVGNFSLSGGNVAGTGTLTLTGPTFTWTNGSMDGAGTTTLASGVTLGLDDHNTNIHDFEFRSFINNGTVNWSGSYLRSGQGGSFTNAAGANFNDLNATGYSITNAFGGSFVFTNNGTYLRNGSGTTYVDTTFNNNGVVSLLKGDLQFRHGGLQSATGSITAAAGTNVYFTDAYSVLDGSSLTGAGTYWLTNGYFAATGNLVVSTFNQTGGTLGSTNTISGTYNWSGGNWDGVNSGDATTIASKATLNLSDTTDNIRDFDARAIVNNGTVNWNGGLLRSGDGGSFTIAAGATFNDLQTGSYRIYNAFGGGFTFTNNGTYTRNAAGTTSLDTTFNNNGSLVLQQGDLQLRGGGTMGAASVVTTAAGTHLYFTNDYTIDDGATFSDAGLVNQQGGTLTLNGTLAATSFLWSGGNWNAANNSGLTTTVGHGTTLTLADSSDGGRNFNGRAIVNNGTVNWNAGYLQGGNGSTFVNNATFDDQQTQGGAVQNPNFNGTAGTFSFTNNGTYLRNGATTTYFRVPFYNNGTLTLQTGDLQLLQGGAMGATSVVTAAAGTHLYFLNDYTIADGATFSGAGLVNQQSGTLTLNGTLAAASFLWSGGNWNAAANSGLTTTLDSGTTLTLTDTSDSSRSFNGRAIVNNGTVNWNAGYLYGGNGSTFTNNGTFNDLQTQGYNVNNPNFGGTFSFTNNGTYIRNGSNTTVFYVPFNNNGAVTVTAGNLQFNGGGAMSASGTISAATKTSVSFNSDYTIADGASLTGAGTFTLAAGTLTVPGTLTFNTFNQTGGTLAGTNVLNGVYNWNGGDWNAATAGFSTTIARGATLSLSDTFSSAHDFNQRAIVNNGTTNWNAGYLYGGNGSTFTNNGTFNDLQTQGYNINNPNFGGTFSFINNGTYNRNGASTTTVYVPFTNNGAVVVSAGSLQFSGGGTLASAASISAVAGTNVYFDNDFTVANGTSLTGAGAFWLRAGTFTLSGALNVSSFQQTGGTLAGTNSINGNYTWSGGTWNAATNSGLTTTVGVGSTLNLNPNSDGDRDFDSRAIVNQGTVNWSGGYLRSGNGGTFTNATGATFNDFNNNGYSVTSDGLGGAFSFTNNGTYNRNGSNVVNFYVPFNNNGSVQITGGGLQFVGGGTMGAASMVNTSPGTHLYFDSDYTITDGASFTGSGTVNQVAGNLTINGSLTALSFLWSGGNWNAANNSGLTTTIASGTNLTLSDANDSSRYFNGRGIINQGVVNWSGGYIGGSNGSTFTNAAGGTFNDQNTQGYYISNPSIGGTAGTFIFTNAGVYNKAGTATTTFYTTFNNNGTVNLQHGTVVLNGGGTMGAGSVVSSASGTTLNFTNDYTVTDGAQFTGAGLFEQTGGTLEIDGTLKASAFYWNGGNWNAPTTGLTTTVGNGTFLNLTGGSTYDFNQRNIVNQGTVTWSTGYLEGGNGSTFVNNGLFKDLNTAGYAIQNPRFGGTAGTFVFTNNNLYLRNGSGSDSITVPFNNNGAVNVQAGDLQFTGGGTQIASAHMVAASGSNVHFANGYTFADGTSLAGPGNFWFDSGTLNVPGTFNFSNFNQTGGTLIGTNTLNGTFGWNGGDWNAASAGFTTTIGASATLNLTAANSSDHEFNQRVIVNNGTTNWYGGYVYGGNGSAIVNNGTFNDYLTAGYTMTNPNFNGTAGTFVFTNNSSGQYVKQSAGTSTITIPFTNNGGLVVASAGSLVFQNSFTHTAGGVVVTNGATIEFDQGLNLTSGALGGIGTIRGNVISSGYIVPGATTKAQFPVILFGSSATVTGSSSTASASTGTLNLTGTLTLQSTSALILQLGGATQGSGYDFLNVSGSAALGGTLAFSFVNGFENTATGGQTLTVLTASSLSGVFSNAPTTGTRLISTDGLGSFQVNYAGSSVTLTNFVPIPEPSTWALMVTGLGAVAFATRRRRK